MTGVQQMVDRIVAQANAERDQKIEQAKQQMQERLAQAEQAAQQESERRAAQTERQAAETVAFAHSAAELIRRNAVLAQRRELIAQTLSQMLAQLSELPTAEYFAMLEGMVVRAAQPGEGELRLNQRDLDRMPADFAGRIAKPGAGCTVRIGQQAAAIDGGFILRYAQTDMDCSFASLLEEKREALEDLIQNELFAG